MKELRKALAQVEREITNYRRAVARGDFRSLDTALTAAELRQATLQAEVARADGNPQQAVVQLTPEALDHHLQGLTEKLRSDVNGKVREVMQRAVQRILAGVDGNVTIEAHPGGMLGLGGELGQAPDPERRVPIEAQALTVGRRTWNLVTGT